MVVKSFLTNFAVGGAVTALEGATEEQIRKQFDVNVFGLMRVTKAILPHFVANFELRLEHKPGVVIWPGKKLEEVQPTALQ